MRKNPVSTSGWVGVRRVGGGPRGPKESEGEVGSSDGEPKIGQEVEELRVGRGVDVVFVVWSSKYDYVGRSV